jgi:hypothetical protein
MAIFLAGFATMMSGVAVGNFATWAMVEEINKRRNSGAEISQFGWSIIKSAKVTALYRSAAPSGRLLKRRSLGIVLMAVGFAAVITAGFLPQ